MVMSVVFNTDLYKKKYSNTLTVLENAEVFIVLFRSVYF